MLFDKDFKDHQQQEVRDIGWLAVVLVLAALGWGTIITWAIYKAFH